MAMRWPPQAVELLHDWYGLMEADEIARRLTKRFGKTFTENAVWKRAGRDNLTAATAQGMITLSEAARQLGLSQKAVKERAEAMGGPRARATLALFSPEEIDRGGEIQKHAKNHKVGIKGICNYL